MLSVNDSQLPVYAINRWGPSMWDAMLACAYVYPRRPSARDRKNMTAFLTSLSPVLPCGDCRHHFASELDRMPDDVLDSSDNLMMWMYDVQCNIADRKGRMPQDFDCFMDNVTKKRKCVRATWKQLCILLTAILLCLICCCIYKKAI